MWTVQPMRTRPKSVGLVWGLAATWRYGSRQTDTDIGIVMVALCNRADHYIFILFLPLPLPLLLFLLFPRLISAVGDWMSPILPHMVWP